MNKSSFIKLIFSAVIVSSPLLAIPAQGESQGKMSPQELSSSSAPQINGPSVFGVRPEHPVLYTIPATGKRPIAYAAMDLPPSLSINTNTGCITGVLKEKGTYPITLCATNKLGAAQKKFTIIVGDRIALTPAMGWSSWNCFGEDITQDKILRMAKAMVSSGLSQHGFSYINMDDGWQGERTGPDHALVGNKKFPDIPGLVKSIHDLGLKVGIYSTPWETSYAVFPGGSAESEDGQWKKIGHKMGKISFANADAREWAGWGIDYLKYDWNPVDLEHTKVMSDALHSSGRDIVFSLSNSGNITNAAGYAQLAESWRTTGDIYDVWRDGNYNWHYSVSEIGFAQDSWAPFAGPGHWNDPDMLVVGELGVGTKVHDWVMHLSHLTHDQQYSHISLWCMLAAPLIIGCDLEKLDPFTLKLLSNDEVLAIDQDELGKQAIRVGTNGAVDFYMKPLADGSFAFGIFNRGDLPATINVAKLSRMGISGKLKARDLWRHQDIPNFDPRKAIFTIPANGVVLLKLSPEKQPDKPTH